MILVRIGVKLLFIKQSLSLAKKTLILSKLKTLNKVLAKKYFTRIKEGFLKHILFFHLSFSLNHLNFFKRRRKARSCSILIVFFKWIVMEMFVWKKMRIYFSFWRYSWFFLFFLKIVSMIGCFLTCYLVLYGKFISLLFGLGVLLSVCVLWNDMFVLKATKMNLFLD